MHILITGICGFVGSSLAKELLARGIASHITGIDNFSRPGSETNRRPLQDMGIRLIAGDIRNQSDIDALPPADWVIDASANPRVLAGVDNKTSSRQLVEHNLSGTINLLEYCKRHSAGFILPSTSRVYSIPPLADLKMLEKDGAFMPDPGQTFPAGISQAGISESFSTLPPVSLYGSTKFASEHLALEYGATYEFPVWINRCSVMAGAGQFGDPTQGIFAFWIHSFHEQAPLEYIGFGGKGYQVRDCFHPNDLAVLIQKQIKEPFNTSKPKIINISGGVENSMSLKQLTQWCCARFAPMDIASTLEQRSFDIPWMVLDSKLANAVWGWCPKIKIENILEEIADFAESNNKWLELAK